jgi:uncharacterized membrane protein YcgQ (UPF0703/DUF1980 family)
MSKNKLAKNSFIIAAAIITINVCFFTIGCAKTNSNDESDEFADIVEIGEKMFINQVNDVYLNSGDYLGKTIKLEGIFKRDEGYEKTYFFVIRYGPGCCGNDGNAGFEVVWANEKEHPYPAEDSWVEAAGVLKTYEEDDVMQYLYLDLSSLNVLNSRGAETVFQ